MLRTNFEQKEEETKKTNPSQGNILTGKILKWQQNDIDNGVGTAARQEPHQIQ